jgi:hypothetical protein
MSDTNNVADTFGGGAHKRRDERLPAHLLPKSVPVPTFADERDAGVISDSDRVVEQLRSTMDRAVAATNKPAATQTQSGTQQRTPLMEIAERIKKLVHDHGEQFGDELKAKIEAKNEKGEPISLAKALQKWADDTLEPKEKEGQRGA